MPIVIQERQLVQSGNEARRIGFEDPWVCRALCRDAASYWFVASVVWGLAGGCNLCDSEHCRHESAFQQPSALGLVYFRIEDLGEI